MKALSLIIVVGVLAGCSSMGTSGTSGMSSMGVSGTSGLSNNQLYINRHDNPADTYFGG